MVLKQLHKNAFKGYFTLSLLSVIYPKRMYLTYQATRHTLVYCDKTFGKAHHTNGVENAYRHALWNAAICLFVTKTTTVFNALKWAKKLTDMHETIFPNKPIETAMDLHNNVYGRRLFAFSKPTTFEEITQLLHKNLKAAKPIQTLPIPTSLLNNLVFLNI